MHFKNDNCLPTVSNNIIELQDGNDVLTDITPSFWAIIKSVIRDILETLVLTIIIFFLIQSVIRNFRVEGSSMQPTLQNGQYLIVDKISYNLPLDLWEPQRGDVIVFSPPTQPDKDFVKRIIGLPGETIEIAQGQIIIDGVLLDEPFGARIGLHTMGASPIPEGNFFVMGDNRPYSNDSRSWGTVAEDRIVGRVWISYWPPESWGTIPNDDSAESATLFHVFHVEE
ncbi:MAG: signal peptidase I [Anaerolineaceae bacterium 4572_78]|nr:MAG: signal peptidase I [Anaerolineaceae bacterium 4572_78]